MDPKTEHIPYIHLITKVPPLLFNLKLLLEGRLPILRIRFSLLDLLEKNRLECWMRRLTRSMIRFRDLNKSHRSWGGKLLDLIRSLAHLLIRMAKSLLIISLSRANKLFWRHLGPMNLLRLKKWLRLKTSLMLSRLMRERRRRRLHSWKLVSSIVLAALILIHFQLKMIEVMLTSKKSFMS